MSKQVQSSKGDAQQIVSPNQVKSISGGATAEFNYGAMSPSQPQVVGPQLTFDKNQLCMMTPVTVTKQDQVIVSNVGSTTITYDWRKVVRGDFIPSKNSDGIQRFYCHYPHGVLKPGETKTFTFSFRSAEKPGMFFEEWELLTDPQLLQTLPQIYLSGIATLSDEVRQNHIAGKKASVEKVVQDTIVKESLNDVLDQVREPEQPEPDMRDPETFRVHFELNNRHLGLYYSPSVMSQLYELLEDIIFRAPSLQEDQEAIYQQWNGSIDFVEGLLAAVENPFSRQAFKERYMRILSQARKVPTDRAQSYPVFRNLLLSLSEQTIDFEQRARDELQTIANPGFIVPSETSTPEELKKWEDDKKAKKADWYKATKKKPKTDDEELQELEELKSKTTAAIKNELISNRLSKIGRDIEILRTKWLMDNHITMDRKQYDDLLHLESVLDIDVAGKDLIVRLDLDVPLSAYTPPTPESLQATLEELNRSQQTKEIQTKTTGGKKANGKNQLDQSQIQKVPDEPWRKREIIDHTLIKRAANELRYLQQERMANRTFVLGNLSDKSGRIKPENSMRIVHHALQRQLNDQPLVFLEDAVIADFEQKKENEFFQEQTTFILENLNFKPDEYGYVEPEKPPEEPKPSEEELKRIEEEKQKELIASQQKGAPAKGAPPAKPAPVDKKKEEEAKKKLEEELAAKKKAEELAASAGKQLTEEEKAEIQRQKEEAERLKREAEYFDYKTIHKFKENLGRYGEIYVNDAPIATLSGSNSISEIKCRRKVMGVKMTEELRKICKFFLKKHPKDISDLWYNKPSRAQYHNQEFTAVIGGSVSSVQEILDRILVVNALLDQTKSIYLGGQFGLAALNALGIKVGSIDNQADFDQTVEFFNALFVKAIENKAKLHFPHDFIISTQSDIEAAKQEQSEQDLITQQQQQSSQQHVLILSNNNQNSSKNNKTQAGNTTANKTQLDSKTAGQINQTNVTNGAGGAPILEQSSIHAQQVSGAQIETQFKHWADRIVLGGKARQTNVGPQVSKLWNEIVKQVYQKYCDKGQINAETDPQVGDHPLTRDSLYKQVKSDHQEGEEVAAPAEEVKPEEVILEYNSDSRLQLLSLIPETFKLLWDGALSPLTSASDSISFGLTNKLFVEKLLDLRVSTQNDDEPPVTLLHGPETEHVVKQSLLRIKIEQQEALEEQKRKAKEARLAMRSGDDDEDEEEEEEETEQANMTNNDESMSGDHTGGSQEMSIIADFHCYEIPQFTTKVMQGVANRSLLGMSKHTRKTQKVEAEDLFLLDEI